MKMNKKVFYYFIICLLILLYYIISLPHNIIFWIIGFICIFFILSNLGKDFIINDLLNDLDQIQKTKTSYSRLDNYLKELHIKDNQKLINSEDESKIFPPIIE